MLGQLNTVEQKALSHHIIRSFSYNAQYSSTETTRLGLSASPFSYQNDNPYLRSSLLPWTDYVKQAMKRALSINEKDLPDKCIFFVDSGNIRSLLELHLHCVSETTFKTDEIDEFINGTEFKALILKNLPSVTILSGRDLEFPLPKSRVFLDLTKSLPSETFDSTTVIKAHQLASSLQTSIVDSFIQEFEEKGSKLNREKKQRIKDQVQSIFIIGYRGHYNGQNLLIIPNVGIHRKLIDNLLSNYGYKPEAIKFTDSFVGTEDVFDVSRQQAGPLVKKALDAQILRADKDCSHLTKKDLLALKARLDNLPSLSREDLNQRLNNHSFLAARLDDFNRLETKALPTYVGLYRDVAIKLINHLGLNDPERKTNFDYYLKAQLSQNLKKVLK